MTKEEILEGLRDMMVELFEFERDEIQLEAHVVNDLDLDSIDAIDMAVRLQEIIGRKVEESELRSIKTVSDIVDFVYALLKEKS
jgi:acyl carrier protein